MKTIPELKTAKEQLKKDIDVLVHKFLADCGGDKLVNVSISLNYGQSFGGKEYHAFLGSNVDVKIAL